ncbi:MAG: VCBS repeat-containing protein [Acidobacteria bacterium]|nr:VCBS repeat-containing protein [Acidobacteriota bacterium]
MKPLYKYRFASATGALLLSGITLWCCQTANAGWPRYVLPLTDVSITAELPNHRPAVASLQSGTPKATVPAAAFKRVIDLSDSETVNGSQAAGTGLADLNEDGFSDLVTAYPDGLLTVRFGTAEGSFQNPTSFNVDARVRGSAAGDVTGDGHIDLIAADASSDSLIILVGDGRGGLPEAQGLTLPGSPQLIVVKDILGDQRAELLVLLGNGHQAELLLWQDVAWLQPMGSSTLTEFKPRTLAVDPSRIKARLQGAPVRVDAGYIDSDSFADLVVVSERLITVMFGARSAPFQRFTEIALDDSPIASVTGDFNGDVRNEIAVLNGITQEVVLFDADQVGQLAERQRIHAGATASNLATADINGDQVDDLVVVRTESKQVAVFLGERRGTLGIERVTEVEDRPILAVPGYLDNDQASDLIVVHARGISLLTTGGSSAMTARGAGDSPTMNVDPPEINIRIPETTCRTTPLTITVAPRIFRPLDIYVLVDASNSFTDEIRKFIQSGNQFVDQLLALRADVRLGVGNFKNEPIPPFGQFGGYAHRREIDLQQVTMENRQRMVEAFHRIITGDGADVPESQLPALFEAATGPGEDQPGIFADVPPGPHTRFRQNIDVDKVIVLVTGRTFHNASDPEFGLSYPGPSFADTIAALRAKGIKVISIAAGARPGVGAADIAGRLRQIASATGAIARHDIDCDGDGTIDIRKGTPIVCPPPSNGFALKNVILSALPDFDLPVPLTLELDRNFSTAATDVEPQSFFVDPYTGGSFTFTLTFCSPCLSVANIRPFETKVLLGEIIRARIPSRIECVCVRPVCVASPRSLGFDTSDGRSLTVTLSNTGNGPFMVSAINSSNPVFTVVSTSSPLPANVAPGGSLRVTVLFKCTVGMPGPEHGFLSFVTTPEQDCLTKSPLCAPIPLSGDCFL